MVTTGELQAPTIPMFEDHSLYAIQRATGYGLMYLAMLAEGTSPITERFRFRAIKGLGKTEVELFGEGK